MFLPILLLFIAFVSSLSAIMILRPIAIKIGLVDKPDSRKTHIGKIPLIGGIAVYIGLFVSCIILLFYSPDDHYQYLFTC
jgi:UDP-GlcNAc:undecaprenyl-phosphate GlcNAc-1-phosphate transferase